MFAKYAIFFVFTYLAIQTHCELARDLTDATAKFTLNLLKNSGPFENVFFSPASISACLGMVYAGSNGTTKAEINDIAYGGLPDSKIYGDIKHAIEEMSNLPKGYTFNVANRVYSTKESELLDSFKNNLVNNFKSDIIKVDFTQTEPTRQLINEWVKEKTKDMIKNLLPSGSIQSLTKIVLVNALHFKGNWMYTFLNNKTKQQPFFASANEQFNISMMEMTSDDLYYGGDKDFQVAGLPFQNETMFMYIILPREKNSLSQLEGRLNANQMLTFFNKTKKIHGLRIKIPKFKLEKELKLKEVLIKMNVTNMFTSAADLSGMFGSRGLFITSAFHKAAIEVNEEGSEAAAATASVGFTRSLSSGPPVFIADHPFLFAIVHRETNAILFFGRFVNNKFQ